MEHLSKCFYFSLALSIKLYINPCFQEVIDEISRLMVNKSLNVTAASRIESKMNYQLAYLKFCYKTCVNMRHMIKSCSSRSMSMILNWFLK